MEREAGQVHIDKEEARSGNTPHIVRYVLIISTVLAIVALSAIWITGALSTTNSQSSQQVEQEVAAQENGQ